MSRKKQKSQPAPFENVQSVVRRAKQFRWANFTVFIQPRPRSPFTGYGTLLVNQMVYGLFIALAIVCGLRGLAPHVGLEYVESPTTQIASGTA